MNSGNSGDHRGHPDQNQSAGFPPVSPRVLKTLGLITRIAGLLRIRPRTELQIHRVASRLLDDLVRFDFRVVELGGLPAVEVTQLKRRLMFPAPLPRVKMRMIASGYLRWLRSKYELPGFVEVEQGDVVVDCGAYVGGFGLAVQHAAIEVHMFEPSSNNFTCLALNAADDLNVCVHRLGLSDTDGVGSLRLSSSGVEHSFLTPDAGSTSAVESVPVARLDTLWPRISRRRVTFLKVEAEGLEPEILDGALALLPAKIAVDVSPERDGRSPADRIENRLVEKSYIVKRRGHVMFAKCAPPT